MWADDRFLLTTVLSSIYLAIDSPSTYNMAGTLRATSSKGKGKLSTPASRSSGSKGKRPGASTVPCSPDSS